MTTDINNLKEAMLYDCLDGSKVRCNLCGFRCVIAESKFGRCNVRQNIGGTLYSLNYHSICAANPDPIEKKPLYHFQPGSKSFSIAAPGCNFRCSFCQNWQISQPAKGEKIEGQKITPDRIVSLATQSKCRSIAYTYTEPTVFMELAYDCGLLAKQAHLANVFVSNGYMTKEAIDAAAGWLDGINIDLKAFSENYYQHLCKAKFQPVLDTIEYIAKQTDIWMEITTLIVPGENDSDDELKKIAEFILNSAGPNTPWHLSRFYPQYEYIDSVPTPAATLQRANEIGTQAGLKHVYIGNLPSAKAENTYCPQCRRLLIERNGFYMARNNIENSLCPHCGKTIAGFEL